MAKNHPIIGIDEVGRGPLAGPVCVCALMVKVGPEKFPGQGPRISSRRVRRLGQTIAPEIFPARLRDSKKLSAKQREVWYEQIRVWQKEGKLDFKISFVSASMIDKIGISKAIKKALNQSLYSLVKGSDASLPQILLDGGLKAPIEFRNQKTIIKGDEKEVAIALASIVAKVSRDALMTKMSKKFPNYEFHLHKGYGTKLHYEKIKKHGISPIHRTSFLKKNKTQ